MPGFDPAVEIDFLFSKRKNALSERTGRFEFGIGFLQDQAAGLK